MPLGESEPYIYSYVNPIYNAPVEERHVRVNDQLPIASVASPDPRAIEYLRGRVDLRDRRHHRDRVRVGGYLRQPTTPIERALLIVAGLLLLAPGYRFDVIGVGLGLVALALQLVRGASHATAAV